MCSYNNAVLVLRIMNICTLTPQFRVKLFYNVLLLVIVTVFITATECNAQPPSVWAKAINASNVGNSYLAPGSMKVDAAGNTYVAGSFGGTVDFDPGAGAQILTSISNGSLFMSKFDEWGNLVWVKTMPCTNPGTNQTYANVSGILLDASGNIYMAGSFNGTIDFDPGGGTRSVTSMYSSPDAYILKLDALGNLLWVNTMGNLGGDIVKGIALDAAENVIAVGSFEVTVDFDAGPGTAPLTAVNGYSDIFILKLDEDGNYIWAKSAGAARPDQATAVALDVTGNIYVTGVYDETVDFDPGPGTADLTSRGFNDIFVLKLDANGNYVWAKSMGGSSHDAGKSIAVDVLGNTYITGYFYATADFDPGAGDKNLTAVGYYDIFIAKLDPSGNLIWVKSMGGPDGEVGESITLDNSCNVYSTGLYAQTVDFDPGSGTHNLTAVGGAGDAYVSKLDSAGNFVWAGTMGNNGFDAGVSIAVNGEDNVYAIGRFEGGPADFDPGSGVRTISATSNQDMFMIYLSATAVLPLNLLQLQANNNNTGVLLQWQTAQEQNTASFTIERSADGRQFSSVGSVVAANTTLINNYTFNDVQPLAGTSYYRLKMLDADGHFTHSRVVAVKRNESSVALQLFPNPTTNVLHIQANGQGVAGLQITNTNGHVLQQQQVMLNGTTSFTINMQHLPAGCYYLILQHEQERTVQVFLKQ